MALPLAVQPGSGRTRRRPGRRLRAATGAGAEGEAGAEELPADRADLGSRGPVSGGRESWAGSQGRMGWPQRQRGPPRQSPGAGKTRRVCRAARGTSAVRACVRTGRGTAGGGKDTFGRARGAMLRTSHSCLEEAGSHQRFFKRELMVPSGLAHDGWEGAGWRQKVKGQHSAKSERGGHWAGQCELRQRPAGTGPGWLCTGGPVWVEAFPPAR